MFFSKDTISIHVLFMLYHFVSFHFISFNFYRLLLTFYFNYKMNIYFYNVFGNSVNLQKKKKQKQKQKSSGKAQFPKKCSSFFFFLKLIGFLRILLAIQEEKEGHFRPSLCGWVCMFSFSFFFIYSFKESNVHH